MILFCCYCFDLTFDVNNDNVAFRKKNEKNGKYFYVKGGKLKEMLYVCVCMYKCWGYIWYIVNDDDGDDDVDDEDKDFLWLQIKNISVIKRTLANVVV